MRVTPVSIRRKILTGDICFTEKGRSSRKGERPFSIPNERRSYLCFRGIYRMKFKTCCTLPEKAPFTGKTANITPSVPFRIFPFRTEADPRIPLCAACLPPDSPAALQGIKKYRRRPSKERSGMGICLKNPDACGIKRMLAVFYLYKLKRRTENCRFLRAREQVLLHGEALHTHGGAANQSSDENKTPRRAQSGDGNPPFLQPYAALHLFM